MANMVKAYGTIYARADKKETLEAIGLLLDIHRGFWCSTEANYDESVILEEDGSFLFNISFTGAGRWEYQTNVENFFDWVWNIIGESDSKLSEKLKAAFELLDQEAFELSFDFCDCGSNMSAICTQMMEINVNKDLKVSGGKTRDWWPYTSPFLVEPSPQNPNDQKEFLRI